MKVMTSTEQAIEAAAKALENLPALRSELIRKTIYAAIASGDLIPVDRLEKALVAHWTELGGIESTHFGAHEQCKGEPLYRRLKEPTE